MKMKRWCGGLVLAGLLICLGVRPAVAFFGKSAVVKVNHEAFSREDVLKWWKYWKEKGMTFPETAKPFVDWVLLSQEARAMGMEDDPSYKRKVQVFIEVRSLLQLRYDEVGKKIKLNPEVLWKEYERAYVPRLRMFALVTDKPKEAEKWKAEIQTPEDFQRLYEKLKKEKKAKDFKWERPMSIPDELKKPLLSAKAGDIIGPVKYRMWTYLFWVKERKGADKEDYQKLHRKIAVEYKKRESARLTRELIQRLKKNYNIQVDKELLKQIGLEKLPDDVAKKDVVKIGDKSMTAEQLQAALKREVKLRVKKGGKPTAEQLDRLKEGIINNTIAQTLTTWEALNRHYEKTALKDICDFYKRHRLVRELENKVFWPEVKVTDEDVRKYYQEHLKDFTRPARVEIAVIRTKDEKLIRKTYRRIHQGEDFFDVARDVMFHGVHPERRALDNLVPEMVAALKSMKPGDISPIIKFKDWYAIVKLIRRYPEQAHPFKMVKKSLRKELLKKRFNEVRDAYLEKLRSRSKIEVDADAWKSIKKSLEKKDEPKKG